MSWTIPLFRIFGIRVRAHWFLALMVAVYLLQAGVRGGLPAVAWTTVTMAILFATILIHELAHCWAAVRVGAGADEILLWPLGGLSYVGHTGSPQREIKIAAAGPLTNFILCGACLGGLVATGLPWLWSWLNPFESWWPFGLSLGQTFLLHAARLNLILGLFNLCVPAYPLDGGRILLGFLTMRYGLARAAGATALIAMPVGIAMSVWGFAQGEFMLAIIGLWVLFEAYELRQYVQMGEVGLHPIAGGMSEFGAPPAPPRPGFIKRWRQRHAEARARRRARSEAELHEKVDAILDKVSRGGMASLTFRERRLLMKASRRNRSSAVDESGPINRPATRDRARRT